MRWLRWSAVPDMDRPTLSVVTPIRDGAPLLNDIPGQLRKLADDIERGGEYPEMEAMLTVGIPASEFTPVFWGWGNVPQRHQTAGVFLHCAQLALTDAE